MKLSKVQIRQFRSIATMDIVFHRSCLVLLGINESGKTNILEALSLLSATRKVQPLDKRQPASEERSDQEGFVRFIFDLSSDDREKIVAATIAAICGDLEQLGFLLSGEPNSVEGLVARAAETALFQINLDNGSKYPSVWRMDAEIEIAAGWLVPKERCPAEILVLHPTRGHLAANSLSLVGRAQVLDEGHLAWFRDAEASDLVNIVSTKTRELVKSQLPECVFWTYRRDDALPSSVPWAEFQASPRAYPVVENMFRLAGVVEPAKAVKDASKTPTGVRRLLERVGNAVTNRLRDTWDDFNRLSIELHENGVNLECIIRDEDGAYTFTQRSDGFRRFVSFLLMVSTREASGSFEGGLLLYDEPDTSLHPSGARQLREELLRLSKSNTVVFSTHSIFMVDADDLERHLIVTKQGEKTTFRVAQPGALRDEEVLYQAVGHTVYDVLKRRNVILEGWRDKKLIEVALVQAEADVRAFFDDVGLCHARGVKRVPDVAPMVEMLARPYLVLSDSDRVAKETRRDEDSRWPWKLYEELTTPAFETAEDFISAESLKRFLQEASNSAPELKELELDSTGPFVGSVKTALAKKGVGKNEEKRIVSQLKDVIFSNLAPSDLKPEMQTLLIGVRDALLRQVAP